jgi:fibronectin type 3 domain-containing protein
MKKSRDREASSQLSQAEIDQIVALCAAQNVTHITIDTHYEYPNVIQQWVTSIRGQGKKIYWRCAPNQWENNNGVTGIMSPSSFNSAMNAFITNHPGFFASGDIFDPCSEPEDGHYWTNKYGSPVGWPGNTAAANEYNNFVISSSDTANAAFGQIGVSGVSTDIHSMNSFMAENVLSSTAVTRMHNHVTVDTYPEGTSTDPTTCANDRKTEYDAVNSKWPSAVVCVGEMGYCNATSVSDTTQSNVLSAEFTMMEGLSFLGGVNYWVGPGSDTEGGHTFVMVKNSSGTWVARPGCATLSNFYWTVLVPGAPQSLSATTVSSSQINLHWAANTEPNLAGYNVYRSTTSGFTPGPGNRIASGVTSTSYSDTGLSSSTTYYYVVTAISGAGLESAPSSQAGATTQAALPPPAPTNLSATGGNGQISLTWTASSGATSYNVKRSSTTGGPYTTVASGVTSTSYADAGLAAGTTYYYVVTAVNGAGESGKSNEASAITQPAAPTNLTASGGNAQVSLTWTASTGAASYNVYRSTTSGGPYTRIASGVTSTSYTDSGLANGTTYFYVVIAVNSSGTSGNSNQASATPSGGGGTVNPISINFSGSGTPMGSSESAGVVVLSNWNNAAGLSGSGQALVDSTGAASGATLTWNDPKSASSTSISDTAGNDRMMKYYLDASDTTTTTVTVSNLASNPNGYNVYVYFDGNNSETREGAYTISGTGITTTTINGTDTANTDFSGTFTQANNSAGNYLVFAIGNVSGFTVKATAVANGATYPRAPLNGIQIIPRTAPAIGNPISINFSGSGTLMGSSESAGVVATTNWNNAAGLSGNNQALVDSTGTASGAKLTWSDPKSESSTSISDTAGNNRMMKYYLDASDTTTTTVTVSSLSSNANGFKVYVYFDGNNSETREGAYTINGTGIATTTINGIDNANTDFSGTFTQANNSAGNYLVFAIGNVSGFTVKATAVANGATYPRAPLNGVQILPQ